MFTFRNAQYEYNLFDLYAAPEIAQHLEALALQGWQLEHIGPVFWRYRKCPPADLHYAVVYFPKDPADEYISRQQRELWELCRTTGWELTATAGQMQVFRTAEKEPVPIETDPVVQMETIHAAMRVRDSVLFAGSLIFYILLLLPLLLLTRSAGNWAAWFRLFLPALLLYILPCCITLVSHLLWYRSARQTAQNENRLQAPMGNRRLNAVHTILALICLFPSFSASSQSGTTIWPHSPVLSSPGRSFYWQSISGSVTGCNNAEDGLLPRFLWQPSL